jgi:ABC-type multidrug transport system ATPase subunit
MIFYTETPDVIEEYPYVVLTRDNWDDFGYRTLYAVEIFINESTQIYLGAVKILHGSNKITLIPDKFKKLTETFFTLGQNIEYYERLVDLGSTICDNYLKALNDLALNEEALTVASEFDGLETSLLRNSEAQKTLHEAKYLFINNDFVIPNNIFKFTFNYKSKIKNEFNSVHFDFQENEHLPFRINALIGKNGTGKTRLLAELANSLSGYSSKYGGFTPSRPVFSRVIAISYSYFDEFKKPRSTKEFSYRYCGFRTKDGLMSKRQLEHKLNESVSEIKRLDLIHFWKKLLSMAIDNAILIGIERSISEVQNELSSGQKIILTTITELLANIRMESLLLYDEPELYLHPDAISDMMKIINKILEKFNSYAVVSTHSPIVLQEIPSKYVNVIEKNGDIPLIRKLGIECFGEDLNSITEDVFGVSQQDNLYKLWFTELIKKQYSYNDIINIYEGKLSFNAKVFIKTLIKNRSDAKDLDNS